MIFSDSSGPAFLGSPVWGSSSYFASFVSAVVDKVSALRGHLQDLRIHRWSYIYFVVVLVSATLTIFYIQFLPIPFCHSFSCLIVIFVTLCAVFVMPLCLIELGARLPCFSLLVVWVCTRLHVFCQQSFLAAVLVHRDCLLDY